MGRTLYGYLKKKYCSLVPCCSGTNFICHATPGRYSSKESCVRDLLRRVASTCTLLEATGALPCRVCMQARHGRS